MRQDDNRDQNAPVAKASQPRPRSILRLPAKQEPPADPLHRTRAAAGDRVHPACDSL